MASMEATPEVNGSAAAASAVITDGRSNLCQATPISGGQGYGVAAASMPFRRIHGLGSPAAEASHVHDAATGGFGTADLSPIHARRGLTGGSGSGSSHGRTFTGSGSWDAAGGASPISLAFRRQPILDQPWENYLHPPGGFMGILNSHANMHFVGAPSHYAPFKAPRFSSMHGSSAPAMDRDKQPPVVDVDKQPAVLDRDNENVRTEKRILWTTKEAGGLMKLKAICFCLVC